jgi:predicted RNA methylase
MIRTKKLSINLFGNPLNIVIFDYDFHAKNNHRNEGLDIISKCLQKDKCWEPYQTEITKELLKDGGHIFLDVGGHIGYYSLLSSVLNNEVYTIEMSPIYSGMIKENIKLNSITNINLKEITVDKDFNLDSIIDRNATIKLIKCDIEGYEIEFVDSILERLRDKKILNLILEISPKFRENYPEYIKKIIDLGYFVYDIGLSPQRAISTTTTLETLIARKLNFKNLQEIEVYVNNIKEKQSNFLFSIEKFSQH